MHARRLLKSVVTNHQIPSPRHRSYQVRRTLYLLHFPYDCGGRRMDHRTWYCFKYCTRRVLCTKECEEPGRTVWNSEFSKCHLLVGRFRECADHVRASLASLRRCYVDTSRYHDCCIRGIAEKAVRHDRPTAEYAMRIRFTQ